MRISFGMGLLIVIIGGIIGLLVGDIILKFLPSWAPYLRVFNVGFDLKDVNLYFVVFALKFYLRVNIAAVVGMAVALWVSVNPRSRR